MQAKFGNRLLAAALLLLSAELTGGLAFARGEGGCFKVFDATLYSGKPDLSALGIQHLTLIEPARWWAGLPDDEGALRDATKRQTVPLLDNPDPILIDLELPLTSTAKSPNPDKNLARYVNFIDWMREAGYKKPLSYYGSLPVRDYWRAMQGPAKPAYRVWQEENDKLAPIVAKVEALYPSLYTFYPKQEGWVAYARANVAEARRIGGGRPVYPFLWPQYHDSAGAIAHHDLGADYWTVQLRTMKESADGFVIWGGWDFDKRARAPWDENAGWWQATKKFLAETPNICGAKGSH